MSSICNRCPLSLPLQVRGDGPVNPKIIVVGDYPGKEEEKTGIPFSGPKEAPSQIIKRALQSLKYNPIAEVYYTYALRCNPFHRAQKIEVKKSFLNICRTTNLEPELAEIKAPVVIAMGKQAMKSLLPDIEGSVSQNRGRWYEVNIGGTLRFVRLTFSPSELDQYSLFESDDEFKRVKRVNPVGSCGWFFNQDLKAIQEKLISLGLEPAALKR